MQSITDGTASDTSGGQTLRKMTTLSCVGSLAKNLPAYVRNPPIEAAVFAWGVAEDGQLVLHTCWSECTVFLGCVVCYATNATPSMKC